MTRKEIKKLDAIWAELVKDKAGYVCEHCGIRGTRMEAAHVCGRRHRSTRWGYEILTSMPQINAILSVYDLCGHCLCHSCHQHYDEHGPLEKDIVQTIGANRKEKIQAVATQTIAKYQDYETIKEMLENERKLYEHQNSING